MRNNDTNWMPSLLALAGAMTLFWYSRTRSGERVIAQTVDETGAVVDTVYTGVKQVISSILPRGIRNNNPGNIDRHAGTVWKGASPDQSTDSRFVVFTGPEWGIRAIARILRQYQARGVQTLSQVISTWAPPSENDTGSYIRRVTSETGIRPDQLVLTEHYPAIIAAIIRHENGQQPYSADIIARGIELERSA